MILDKEVETTWINKTSEYYISKGYIFTNFYDKFMVKVEDLQPNSNVKIKCSCDKCGKPSVLKYQKYYKNFNFKNLGIYTCRSCSEFKSKITCKEKYGDETYNNREQAKQTCLDEYGVENPAQLESTREKMRASCLESTGYEYALKSPKIKEQIKQFYLDNFGVENAFQVPEYKEKIKQFFLDNFGVDNPMRVPEYKEKLKQFYLDNFGVENAFQVPEYKEKIKQFFLDNFGVDSVMKVPEYREKVKQFFLDNFGVDNPMRVPEYKEKSKQTCNKKYGVPYSLQAEPVKEKGLKKMIELYGEAYMKFSPKYNPNSLQFLDIISKQTGLYIQHAGNSKEKKFHKYWVDGYIPELNVVIEVDESHHKRQKEKDQKRDQYITENFGCTIIRIPWKTINEELDGVIEKINQIKNSKLVIE